jgi:hypothetical protein
MGLVFALLFIVAGILGAASLIIQKQPNARDLIAKVVPFQGIIGIILLIWSLIWLIRAFTIIGYLVQSVWGLLFLLTIVVGIVLGFLLGYGLINQYVLSKSAEASKGGSSLQTNLAKFQAPLGIIAILLGIWMLINSLSSPLFF